MRWIFVILVLFGRLTAASADTVVDLPLGQTVEIVGPYTPNLIINIPVTLSAYGPVLYPIPQGSGVPYLDGFQYLVSVGNGLANTTFEVCAENTPGPCSVYPASGVVSLGSIFGDELTISNAGFYNFFEDLTSGAFYSSYTPPAGSYVTVLATLPDGYSIAAIPEPSTWAMLLIGFAGIGAIGYRRRQGASNRPIFHL